MMNEVNEVIEVAGSKGLFTKENGILALAGIGAVTVTYNAFRGVRWAYNKLTSEPVQAQAQPVYQQAPQQQPVYQQAPQQQAPQQQAPQQQAPQQQAPQQQEQAPQQQQQAQQQAPQQQEQTAANGKAGTTK